MSSTPQLAYRYGTIDDLQQLKELGIDSYCTHAAKLTPDNWAKMNANLQDESRVRDLITVSTVFLCAHNDKIVGMAYLLLSGNPTHIYPADWSYVRMVGVHPDYRGNGICKKLMQQCIELAKEKGEHTIALHTSEIMNDARHIYEKLGFRLVRPIEPVFGLQYWLFKMDL